MARKKRKTEGYVLKSDVETLIQNLIRNIQMNDYGNDSGIPQLYTAMNRVGNLPTADVAPKSEVARKIIDEFLNTMRLKHEENRPKYGGALALLLPDIEQIAADLKKKYTEEKE